MATEALTLYRDLLRYSSRFSAYNFRQYAIRRVRDSFIANRNITDPQLVKEVITKGKEELSVLKRQSIISNMYKGDKLVVEELSQPSKARKS